MAVAVMIFIPVLLFVVLWLDSCQWVIVRYYQEDIDLFDERPGQKTGSHSLPGKSAITRNDGAKGIRSPIA